MGGGGTINFARRAVVAGMLTILWEASPAAKRTAAARETNLGKAPATDGQSRTPMPKGATVEVGDWRNGWCRVSWMGQDGYAFGRDLDVAAGLWWPNLLVAGWPGDSDSSQKIAKTTRKHEKYVHERHEQEKHEHEEHEHEKHEHEEHEDDHGLILKLGPAGECPLNSERPSFGGMIAADVEPIENWLALEFGISTLPNAGHAELSGDLLFKKPFRLSPTVDFMIGVGPLFSRSLHGPHEGNSWSVEFA